MSDFFKGITFPWQEVTPSDDAIVRRAMLPDRRLSGCELSYSGYTLTMAAGSMIVSGRQFRHTAAQNWAVTGASSGYARLLLTIDVTKASTENAFEQISASIEYATAANGFTALRQDDINNAGTIYQAVVCVVSLGAGGITGFIEQIVKGALTSADVGARPNTWMPTAGDVGAAPANVYRCGTKNGDFNDITDPGWYWMQLHSCINSPLGDNVGDSYGNLEVIAPHGDASVLQRFTEYKTGRTWVRSSVNGWQPWVQVITASSFNYSNGTLYINVQGCD